MIKITNLLDWYDGTLPEFKTKEVVSTDRIACLTMEKIHRCPETAAGCRSRRKALHTVLIAAAVATILVVSALAVSGLFFNEIPDGIRTWLGIKDEAVPGYVTYDTVNIAENARTADTDHDGDGEVYVSSGVTVRSENLVTVYVDVCNVTADQYENYIWRAQADNTDEWAIAEPTLHGGEGSEYYESGTLGGRLFLRISFILDPDEADPLHVTLYGGTQTKDGKTFNVERIGIFTVDPGAVSETATVTFGDGISFENVETGETGTITGADISADRIIWYYRADGIYDLYRITYGDRRDDLSDDDWSALNKELMGWLNGMDQAILDARLNYADGTYRNGLIGENSRYFEDDTAIEVLSWAVSDPVDMNTLESITVAGKTFQIK
jgi:hypothetical protein